MRKMGTHDPVVAQHVSLLSSSFAIEQPPEVDVGMNIVIRPHRKSLSPIAQISRKGTYDAI
jgi:hypothetical protein